MNSNIYFSFDCRALLMPRLSNENCWSLINIHLVNSKMEILHTLRFSLHGFSYLLLLLSFNLKTLSSMNAIHFSRSIKLDQFYDTSKYHHQMENAIRMEYISKIKRMLFTRHTTTYKSNSYVYIFIHSFILIVVVVVFVALHANASNDALIDSICSQKFYWHTITLIDFTAKMQLAAAVNKISS